MSIKKEWYGRTTNEKDAWLFTIENTKGMKVQVSNFGAVLTSLWVKNKNGELKDVVLGYEKLEGYFDNHPMFGAVVGRNINRISNGRFEIDGVTYELEKNRGRHNIHSDKENGFHKVLWDYEPAADNGVKFTYISPEGEQGFPGTLIFSVTYILTEACGLVISYRGVSDKKTLINVSNHTYFNLGGHESGNIYNTKIRIFADEYTPVDAERIPTGEIASVQGTPFDFIEAQRIGNKLNEQSPELQSSGGFDHNFVIQNQNIGIRKAAEASCEEEGIRMEIYSDLPGLQFYTSNVLEQIKGKDGAVYGKHSGFCMEPQYYPNSINTEGFYTPLFKKNEEYKTTTIYQFI
ncbi:aldose epimerase family protein [Anaerostipes sp.]|uniref:aldose epimerase family protein n=1 Tax=Anaerostipes sp. TaxID=1872530 RepID=UPI0025C1BF11|nr:aldose epimerase family protein [Anaerostipes sp.]MBS7009439.1 galactose mutarotase [Anaerostipes sp.]